MGGAISATPAVVSLVPSAAISSYYTQQNEVTSSDNLDFRHHSYKDMRQVSTVTGICWGVGSCVGWNPRWGGILYGVESSVGWNCLWGGILHGVGPSLGWDLA